LKNFLHYKVFDKKYPDVPLLVGGRSGGPAENFEILDGRRCNLGIYLKKMKLLIGLKNAGFLG
jgi:hypothetical protein